MVRKATAAEQQEWDVLPSATDIARRRLSSFILMGCLLTLTTPFMPFCWLNCFDFIDYFVTRVILVGALYFQYVIAGIVAPVTVKMLDRRIVWVYKQRMYWYYAAFEVAIVVLVRWSGSELLRKVASVFLVGALWELGYKATGRRMKDLFRQYIWWAWAYPISFPRHLAPSFK
ncbi:uncharacterized protein LY89DRAFT_677523 [Mollisia scopiformis]|uniref:Uncharacterized protein n=1 Tax=Mollisia scopiformis TaxID=149040 RepID=A0A132B6V8_MOLSC|nr:uncharacterized protein LY89DRAFT_677523 [Mollisia scopiformis]KUJ07739.1 hypothetical protein LY89DRAFT_677523 [Mollisia scopiformis]